MKQAKSTHSVVSAFAKESGVRVGPRYRRFVSANEAKAYAGREVTGMPGYTLGSRVRLHFFGSPNQKLFSDLDLPRSKWRSWVPLASVDAEASFFAVDVSHPRAPVSFFNHEDGVFKSFAPSLDAFLAGLLKRSDKTLLERVRDAVALATKAHRKKQYRRMLEVLGTLPEEFTEFEAVLGNPEVASLFNCHGLALKGLGRSKEAIRSFERAIELGSDAALLSVIAVHLEEETVDRAIALGKDAVVSGSDEAYSLMRYLVEAYVRKGRKAQAERELRGILEEHGHDRKRIAAVQEDLRKLARTKRGHQPMVDEFLGWFRPTSPSTSGAKAASPRPEPSALEPWKPPSPKELLRAKVARADSVFKDGKGSIAIRQPDGSEICCTAWLATNESGATVRRGQQLRLLKVAKIEGRDRLIVGLDA
jgi:tetratricopeptide (TPR) repeat protein